MKRIGEIAARLVANPIELVAAANQKRSTQIGVVPPSGWEAAEAGPRAPEGTAHGDELPVCIAPRTGKRASATSSSAVRSTAADGELNGMTRASGDQHASGSQRVVKRLAKGRSGKFGTVASPTTMVRDRRAVVSGRAPRPAARLSLVTVDGVRVDHASATMSSLRMAT